MATKKTPPKRDLGFYLRVYRAERGMNQMDLAAALGIGASFLSLLERGKRAPGRELMAKMRSLIGIPIHALLCVEDDQQ